MASHSSRKRSSRRAGYRQGHKRQRQATRQALIGGRSKLIRPEHWSQRPEQPLLPEDGAPAQPTAKSGPRKERKEIWCPGRPGQRRHHYLAEIRETKSFSFPFGAGWLENGPGAEIYEICAWCGDERVRRFPGR